mmetsp:Transcript_35936/g.86860  ORF Transcript_35936/g.86860 Transcript_35936/m.86860 type:complete len:119 (+) Transcript_35936:344-700(+)
MEMRGTRREGKRILLERDSSRHRCGASFVIPIVVSFLPDGDFVTDDDGSQRDDDRSQDDYGVDESDSDDDCVSDAKNKRSLFLPSRWDIGADDSSNHDDSSRQNGDDDSSGCEDVGDY